MYTAVASLLLGASVRKEVAMTGEISLRGAVLPVGGIKEKLLAAHRAGIKAIVMPSRNAKDLEDVPKDILSELKINLVKHISEVLPIVLEPPVAGAPGSDGSPTSQDTPPMAPSSEPAL
jgi:ATP-dependent Lon protease